MLYEVITKTEILFAVLVPMGDGDLDIPVLKMDDRVEALSAHILLQQIEQTVFGLEFLSVKESYNFV